MTTISSMVSTSMRLQALASQAGTSVPASAREAATASSIGGASSAARQTASAKTVDHTDRIKASGNKKIDTLLVGGDHWFHEDGASGARPSETARHSLTYSFLADTAGLNNQDATGFRALDDGQQSRVREALAYISTVVDVSFTEVGAGGDVQYGSNVQGKSSGYARYPNDGSQVFLANNQPGFDTDWSQGSYAWETLLHETGHALGLKHPGSYDAGGGKTPGPYLPASQDHRGNTVMSYRDAANMKRIAYDGDSFSRSYVNPKSFQANDIAALQYLYGAAATGPTTFQWSAGEIFSQTIYNTNADSVIDLSNQTQDNVLDLRAGRASSIALRDAYADMPFSKAEYARLKSGGKKLSALIGTPGYTGRNNLTLAAGSQIDRAVGGSGKDTFIANTRTNTLDGGQGDDRFFLTGGNATLTGGEGDDTVFLKKKAGAVWRLSEDHTLLTLTSTRKATQETTTLATVSLSDIEHVKYWDGSALKATGKALFAAPSGSAKLAVAYAPTFTGGRIDDMA